ncbi:Serine/threonine-protein kinase Nek1 [Frankliniella fusca]|uniref:Serine/threonine-protein kinase Nek1 n=1 Tax=Frankliniella fusca TaxID=407009 RepID=A0AAE1L652_9NEOP|nr:Serine/threonine-protein kinase Nek1 [Frankliniella fusca]
MLLWKPVLGTAGHSAPPLPPRLFCWCSTLLDVPPRASCHQDGPSLDELRERPGGETQDKTCRAGARAAVLFSLGILGSTGCRSSTQGPAAKSQVLKLRCLQRLGCERCHLRQQRRSEGDVGPCVEERQPVDPKMPSEKSTAARAPALQRKKENSNNYKIQDDK